MNVKTFVPATECQETYDKVFGKDAVKTTEEFDAKIAERLEANYKQEADYRLSQDLRKYLVDKANVNVPEAFLKRWLYENNKEKFSKEDIEKRVRRIPRRLPLAACQRLSDEEVRAQG